MFENRIIFLSSLPGRLWAGTVATDMPAHSISKSYGFKAQRIRCGDLLVYEVFGASTKATIGNIRAGYFLVVIRCIY